MCGKIRREQFSRGKLRRGEIREGIIMRGGGIFEGDFQERENLESEKRIGKFLERDFWKGVIQEGKFGMGKLKKHIWKGLIPEGEIQGGDVSEVGH